jgi:hypothetical protein
VLLAYGDSGALVNPGEAARAGRFAEYRRRLNAGEDVLAQMLEREGLRLAVDRLTYFSHWITPVNAPRRYDTRFFVATLPEGQDADGATTEADSSGWQRPQDAIADAQQGRRTLMPPTWMTLTELGEFTSAQEALSAERSIRPIMPTLVRAGDKVHVVVEPQ